MDENRMAKKTLLGLVHAISRGEITLLSFSIEPGMRPVHGDNGMIAHEYDGTKTLKLKWRT